MELQIKVRGTRANLVGQVFGKLTVKQGNGPSPTGEGATWKCLCECGNWRISTTKALNRGEASSCGCSRKPHPRLGRPRKQLTADGGVKAALKDLQAIFG